MNTLIVILRLLHIVAGAFWFGAVLTSVFFVEPTARAFGDDGDRFLAHFAVRQRLVAVLVVAAIITAVAGGALYWIDSGGLRPDWIATHSGLGFTAGAIAGIAAFAIPGIAFRPTIGRLTDLAAGRATSNPIDARFRRWSVVQAVLLLFAIAAMATARYLP